MISSAIILPFSLFALVLCLPIPSHENLLYIRQAATSLVNTSDAWATVIANIGPLVILVGEKSFKSYVKGCKSWVRYGLYACSPMGGLSTVVSVLRLVGGPLVRTVLGRQNEGLSQVWVEVTSASTSVIGQQFMDGDVASVEAPDRLREAWFIVRGSTVLDRPIGSPNTLSTTRFQSNIDHIEGPQVSNPFPTIYQRSRLGI
jgi:hypothetical protein